MPRKVTDRQRFLELLDWGLPWEKLVDIVEPFYPREENPQKPAIPFVWMPKVYFIQTWFGLTDGQREDILPDSFAVQGFLGGDWGRYPLPNETAILEFRRLIDRHRLRPKLLQVVGEYLDRAGIRISTGKDRKNCRRLDYEGPGFTRPETQGLTPFITGFPIPERSILWVVLLGRPLAATRHKKGVFRRGQNFSHF